MQTHSNIVTTTDVETIKKIIARHGHAAEHNYHHFLNVGLMVGECNFCVVDNNYGVISYIENKKTVWCYSDPLAPKEKMQEVFFQFVEWAFKNGFSKVRAEINESLWEQVVKTIKEKYKAGKNDAVGAGSLRAVKPSYVYQWPAFDLKKWDPTLPGKEWKTLRNMRNVFMRDHKVEFLEKNNASQHEMLKLLANWKKLRQGKDRAHTEHYEAAIKSNFEGYDSIRIICAD